MYDVIGVPFEDQGASYWTKLCPGTAGSPGKYNSRSLHLILQGPQVNITLTLDVYMVSYFDCHTLKSNP